MASEDCAFQCGNPVNRWDQSTEHEVTVWVSGPKKDGAKLRRETGRVAHKGCVHKAMQGQAPDQTELFDDA